jgi:hypothetical protein
MTAAATAEPRRLDAKSDKSSLLFEATGGNKLAALVACAARAIPP